MDIVIIAACISVVIGLGIYGLPKDIAEWRQTWNDKNQARRSAWLLLRYFQAFTMLVAVVFVAGFIAFTTDPQSEQATYRFLAFTLPWTTTWFVGTQVLYNRARAIDRKPER